MAVKVSRSISRRAEIEMFEVSLQRIPIGGKPNDRQAMYAELTALEKIRSTPSPYVVDFYGALIDSVKVFSRFSSRSCDRFSFDIQNELYIFMAYMTTNVEMFYQTMHGTARNSSEDIDQFVRRCAHDVSSSLFVRMTIESPHSSADDHGFELSERSRNRPSRRQTNESLDERQRTNQTL